MKTVRDYAPAQLHDWWRNLSEGDTVLAIENNHADLTQNASAEISIGKIMRGPYDHVTKTTGYYPQTVEMIYENLPYFCEFYPKWDDLAGKLYHLPFALSHDSHGEEIEDIHGNLEPRILLAPTDLDVAAYSERINLARAMHARILREAESVHRIVLEMPIEEIRLLAASTGDI